MAALLAFACAALSLLAPVARGDETAAPADTPAADTPVEPQTPPDSGPSQDPPPTTDPPTEPQPPADPPPADPPPDPPPTEEPPPVETPPTDPPPTDTPPSGGSDTGSGDGTGNVPPVEDPGSGTTDSSSGGERPSAESGAAAGSQPSVTLVPMTLTVDGLAAPLDPLLLAQGPDSLEMALDDVFRDLTDTGSGGSSALLTSFLSYRQSGGSAAAAHRVHDDDGLENAAAKASEPLTPASGGRGPVPGPSLSMSSGGGGGGTASSASSSAALFATTVLSTSWTTSFRVSAASWPLSRYVPPIESPG